MSQLKFFLSKIDLGAKTFHKFRPSPPNIEALSTKYKKELDEEIKRIQDDADEFRMELELIFEKQIQKERKTTKKVNERLKNNNNQNLNSIIIKSITKI